MAFGFMLVNVRLQGFVAEIQLALENLAVLKGYMHAFYKVTRCSSRSELNSQTIFSSFFDEGVNGPLPQRVGSFLHRSPSQLNRKEVPVLPHRSLAVPQLPLSQPQILAVCPSLHETWTPATEGDNFLPNAIQE